MFYDPRLPSCSTNVCMMIGANHEVSPGIDGEDKVLTAAGAGGPRIPQEVHSGKQGEDRPVSKCVVSVKKGCDKQSYHDTVKLATWDVVGYKQITWRHLHVDTTLYITKQSKAHSSKLQSNQHQRNAPQLTRIATQQRIDCFHVRPLISIST